MKIGEAPPLLGLAQNLHPLDNAPAERTNWVGGKCCS